MLKINIYCEPGALWITDCCLEDSQLDYAETYPLKFTFTYSETPGYSKIPEPTINGYIQLYIDNLHISLAQYSPPETPYWPEDETGFRYPISLYTVICNCLYHGYSTSAIIELLDRYERQLPSVLNESDLMLYQELTMYKIALTMGNRPLQAREIIEIANQFKELKDCIDNYPITNTTR